MGHIERERCPFLKGIRVGNPKQKMRRKIRGQKAAKPSFSSHLCCSITRERVGETRDERLREGYARGHTHTHTEREFLKRESERETVCYCAFCESYKRERESERD